MEIPTKQKLSDDIIGFSMKIIANILKENKSSIVEQWKKSASNSSALSTVCGNDSQITQTLNTWIDSMIDYFVSGSFQRLETFLLGLYVQCSVQNPDVKLDSAEFHIGRQVCIPFLQDEITRQWQVLKAFDECFFRMIETFNRFQVEAQTQTIHDQIEKIDLMLKVNADAVGNASLDQVLNQIAMSIADAINIQHCNFYLVDQNQRLLIPKLGFNAKDLPEETIKTFLNTTLPYGENQYTKILLETKKPLVSYDAQTDEIVEKHIVSPVKVKSVIAVPLFVQDEMIAVAMIGTFDDYRRFTEDEVKLVAGMASAAALAIQNAKLNLQVSSLALLQERERIAREIHDSIAQSLSIVKLQTSHVEGLLENGDVIQAKTGLTEIKKLVSEANVDIRESIYNLKNSFNENTGIVDFFRNYLNRYHLTHQLETEFIVEQGVDWTLSPDVTIQLIRIVQEALMNVRKHAQAKKVWVSLSREKDQRLICIKDDGVGFPVDEITGTSGSSFGLQVMQERVNSIHGFLKIDSVPQHGTQITVSIPDVTRRANG